MMPKIGRARDGTTLRVVVAGHEAGPPKVSGSTATLEGAPSTEVPPITGCLKRHKQPTGAAIVPAMSRSLATNLVAASSTLILALSATACSGSDTVDQKSSTGSSDKTKAPDPAKKSVILETGFGQSDEYVSLPALVENRTDHGGQTVTVSYNIKNEAGELIQTETQVESFSYAGQKLALVGWAEVKGRQTVGSVDATLLVEEDGIGEESDVRIEPIEAKVTKGEYGGFTATYKVKNPTTEALQDLRIGVICKDKNGKISGGGSDYPDLVPPSGEIVLATDVTASVVPATCTAYVGPGF